jgi:hypothetical protein
LALEQREARTGGQHGTGRAASITACSREGHGSGFYSAGRAGVAPSLRGEGGTPGFNAMVRRPALSCVSTNDLQWTAGQHGWRVRRGTGQEWCSTRP